MTDAEKTAIGFGIVGCGMIADFHAQALRAVKGARLVGAADASVSGARIFAEKHSVRAYESYEQMLDDDAIDAVCICTPSGYHAELARMALLAGKHVAVEKPVAMTVSEADAVIEAAKNSGRLLTAIAQLRFSPDAARLREAVQGGSLGRIRFANLDMKYWRSEDYYSGSSWKGTRLLDGGVLMNQGVHGIDLLRYVMGDVTVLHSVTAKLHHQIEAPDTALALLRYGGGALGTLEATTAAFPGFDLKLEIIGEKGCAVFTQERLTSLLIDGEEQIADSVCGKLGTASDPAAVGWQNHALQFENFVCAIKGEAPLAVSGEEGREAVRLISEIYGEQTPVRYEK